VLAKEKSLRHPLQRPWSSPSIATWQKGSYSYLPTRSCGEDCPAVRGGHTCKSLSDFRECQKHLSSTVAPMRLCASCYSGFGNATSSLAAVHLATVRSLDCSSSSRTATSNLFFTVPQQRRLGKCERPYMCTHVVGAQMHICIKLNM
jgi:hypothetical protein